jgi:hypothetical protein
VISRLRNTSAIRYITDMTVNPETTTRKLVSFPRSMAREIEDFRFQHRIKTESEAIRRLLERAFRSDATALAAGQAQAAAPDIAPSVPFPPPAAEDPPSLSPHDRPFPTQQIRNLSDSELVLLNTRIPSRLSMQLEWLADARNGTKRKAVEDALRQFLVRELPRFGQKPIF